MRDKYFEDRIANFSLWVSSPAGTFVLHFYRNPFR
jgi:hypothetical protein